LTLIYPPKFHKTSSETIFFIGHANDFLSVNGAKVDLIYEGNFCPIYDLNPGLNVFEINIDGISERIEIVREVSQVVSSVYKFEKYNGAPVSDNFSKICLDPGHGGLQDGTCSPKGIKEKDLNLKLCLKIKSSLDDSGFEVVLTRDSDKDLSLEDRVSIAKVNNCDLFLSIHHNAIPDHLNPIEHRGISAHYYYEHSKELAENLSRVLASDLGMQNNGAIMQNLYVTRENYFSKAILLECGYLIHPIESELIIQDEFQDKFAGFLSKFLKNSRSDI
jgi:N-acetylmuramoyl-L-alanine amidase